MRDVGRTIRRFFLRFRASIRFNNMEVWSFLGPRFSASGDCFRAKIPQSPEQNPVEGQPWDAHQNNPTP